MQPNTDKITLGSLVNRITSPTPDFWKKLRKIWGWAGGVSGALLAIDHEMANLIPHALVTLARVLSIPAVISWVQTFLAKQPDPQPATPTSDDSTANQN